MNLQELQDEVSDCLDRIQRCFKPSARITILVRHQGDLEGRMDFMMGNDDPQEAAKVIARRIAAARERADARS